MRMRRRFKRLEDRGLHEKHQYLPQQKYKKSQRCNWLAVPVSCLILCQIVFFIERSPIFKDVDPREKIPIRVGVYYIPLFNNTNHNFDHYKHGLTRTCVFFMQNSSLADKISAVGHQDAIRDTPSCSYLSTPKGSKFTTTSMLSFGAEAKIPNQNNCATKFPSNKRLEQSVVQIWLNKVNVLCGLANEIGGNDLTFLVDAAFDPQKIGVLLDTMTPWMNDTKASGLALHLHHPTTTPHMNFGRPVDCGPSETYHPSSAVLGIHGRNCASVQESFRAALDDYIARNRCPCFDEERILSHAMARDPHLYHAFFLQKHRLAATHVDVTSMTAGDWHTLLEEDSMSPAAIIDFVHIPKTAGTTVEKLAKRSQNLCGNWGSRMVREKSLAENHAFASGFWHQKLSYGPNNNVVACAEWHIPPKLLVPALQHELYPAANTFCIVRNPLKRLISHYYYSHMGPQTNSGGKREYLHGPCYDSSVGHANEIIQQDLRMILNKQNPFSYGCHLLPQSEFLVTSGEDTHQCKHILVLEHNISAQFNRLMESVGCSVRWDESLMSNKHFQRCKNEPSLYRNARNQSMIGADILPIGAEDLSETTIHLAKQLYKEDFDLYEQLTGEVFNWK